MYADSLLAIALELILLLVLMYNRYEHHVNTLGNLDPLPVRILLGRRQELPALHPAPG